MNKFEELLMQNEKKKLHSTQLQWKPTSLNEYFHLYRWNRFFVDSYRQPLSNSIYRILFSFQYKLISSTITVEMKRFLKYHSWKLLNWSFSQHLFNAWYSSYSSSAFIDQATKISIPKYTSIFWNLFDFHFKTWFIP